MNKILITGADGFIGSHLVEYMVKKNYNVKAFTLYNLYILCTAAWFLFYSILF